MKYSKRGVLLEFCSETLTRAQFFSWIRSHARRLSLKWKPRSDFLKEQRKPYQPYKGDNKRTKWQYKCFKCKKWFKLKDVEVDHKIECGPIKSFDDIGGFYERMLCEKTGYQILCKICHKEKTKTNRKENYDRGLS